MKTLYKFLLAGLTGLSMSCSDYLDTKPISFTTIDNFYQTPEDVEIVLRGAYGRLVNSYAVNARAGIFFVGDIGTDELIGNPYSTPDAASNMDQFIFGRVVKTNLMARDLWEEMYRSLYGLNLLLDKLDAVPMDEGRKVQVQAEATFLRGWHYLYLGMVYGGVPVYTGVPHEKDRGRDPLQRVMEQAMADLQYAYEHLDDRRVPGVANRWTASGYLIKLYCYLASSKKFDVGQSLGFPLNSFDWVDVDGCYATARQLADELITTSGYKLTADYRSLFIEGSTAQQAEEILFTILPSRDNKTGFAPTYYHFPVGYYGGGWGTCRPTQEVYDRYDTLYDARVHWVVGGLATDPGTETIDGTEYVKPLPLNLSNGVAYDGDYNGTKFRPVSAAVRNTDFYFGYYPLLRLADIYLLNAEATAHFDGDEAGREILKAVRHRALIASRTDDVGTLQAAYRRSDFIQELLDERSRELCFEQQRKFDLVRFGRYVSTIKGISTTRGVWNALSARVLVDNISESKIWLPIPEEDEISNPNLLPNNPGY